MTNPNQRAVQRRQMLYIGLIIGLLTLSLVWRGRTSFRLPAVVADYDRVAALHQARRINDFSQVPDPNSAVHTVGDWLASRTILEQASRDSLDLREVDQGDADMTGAAVRLGLTGSRGLVVTYLWRQAMEYQKRNEFPKFEQCVNDVVRMQPNFTTPWLYQSWNISYNVSVENDRLTDTFYYIARGIELLAKGERLNRDSPDMRYYLGFYYQNKFSVHDKVTTLRSIMQVSAIKPSERNTAAMRDQSDPQQRAAFQDFVRKNPQLCRRLREKLNYTTPQQILAFIEENNSVPTRYDRDRQDALLPPSEQFPSLPPRFAAGPEELHPGVPEFDDTFDAFLAARAWFAYSLTVIRPPSADPDEDRFKVAELFKYRMPKAPTLIIFRQMAPRAQTYLAERLQNEGWFELDTKWYPDARADRGEEFWFGQRADAAEAIPSNASSREAWSKAWTMWSLHGEQNGLKYSPAQLLAFQKLAEGVPDGVNTQMTDDQLKAYGFTREQVKARNRLNRYDRDRQMTNIGAFLASTEAEQDPQTVRARQKLFDAEDTDRAGRKSEAIVKYIDAHAFWRQVLVRFKDFHRSDKPEEDTYEMQLKLMALLEKDPEIQARARRTMALMQALVPAASESVNAFLPTDVAREIAEYESNVRIAMRAPQVIDRVNRLIAAPVDDAVQAKEWFEVLKAKRAIAAALANRATAGKLTPEEQQKAADDPHWRAKAVEALTDPKPTAWQDLIAARDDIARAVVAREFDWLPEYRDSFKDDTNRWVQPTSKQAIRERLNLTRRQPAAPSETKQQ